MKAKRVISVMLAFVFCISFALTASANVPQGDAGFDLTFGGEFASSLDLRAEGFVTPVKRQDPWGSCWAFGGIAAAESSILSMLDEKGEHVDAKDFDLSEKHLVWFATHPITDSVDPTQAGEGLFLFEDDDPNFAYENGGFGLFVTTLFSTGVGPVPESAFPYRGKEGLSDPEYLEKYPEFGIPLAYDTYNISPDDIMSSMPDTDMTVDEAIETLDESILRKLLKSLKTKGYFDGGDELSFELVENAIYEFYVSTSADSDVYSKYDDWSIPELDENGFPNRNFSAGYTLVDGNILPDVSIKNEDGCWEGLNPDGIRAVKSELQKGHGVSVAFKADQALPGDPITEDSYLNTETWAQYTHKDEPANHVVCIVGWDDAYPRENFNEDYMPPGDGAWLVKNSWGSETDYVTLENGMKLGICDWGIEDENGNHTGYFWLSYYDKTLSECETMSFDTFLSDLGGDFEVWAYDYMPAMTRLEKNTLVQDENVLKTANVFTNSEDTDAHLYSVSARTAMPDAEVTYSVYKLGDNPENPEDGTLLETKTASYPYPGFHRENLSGDVTIGPGELISVVVEETVIEDGVKLYEYSENAANSKEKSESIGEPAYFVAVVNRGESFLYETDEETGEGKWIDYCDDEGRESVSDEYVIDNFSIKAYVILDDAPDPEPEPSRPRRPSGSGASVSAYEVSAADASNGTVLLSADLAAAGEKVTVTAKPDTGFCVKDITVTDKKGNGIAVTKTGDETFSFKMPSGEVTVTPVFEEIPKPGNTGKTDAPTVLNASEKFSDVDPDAWYADAVQWAVDTGIMVGVSDNEFAPGSEVTRAMVVTMLWRLAGEPESAAPAQFDDVLANAWYSDAVSWAAGNGIVLGVTEKSFAPDEPVTREQLAAILYRYAQSKGLGFTGMWAFPLDFSDAAEVSDYAYEPLCWMTMNGIISGMGDGTIAPKENATRAQTAKIFMLFAEELKAE